MIHLIRARYTEAKLAHDVPNGFSMGYLTIPNHAQPKTSMFTPVVISNGSTPGNAGQGQQMATDAQGEAQVDHDQLWWTPA